MTDEFFSAILGLIVAATIGILVFVDAKRITNSNYSSGSLILWAIGVTLLAILILPTYLLRRSKIFKSYPEAAEEMRRVIASLESSLRSNAATTAGYRWQELTRFISALILV